MVIVGGQNGALCDFFCRFTAFSVSRSLSCSHWKGRPLWARFKADETAKEFEFVSTEGFGEVIGDLFVGGNVLEVHIAIGNLTANSMVLNVDMLDSTMVLRVLCQGDCALIVIEDNDRLKGTGGANLTEQTAEPNSFFGGLGLADILCLTGG